MTDKHSQQERERLKREERLAKNLRDNLRRRKAATRKASQDAQNDKPVTGAPESP